MYLYNTDNLQMTTIQEILNEFMPTVHCDITIGYAADTMDEKIIKKLEDALSSSSSDFSHREIYKETITRIKGIADFVKHGLDARDYFIYELEIELHGDDPMFDDVIDGADEEMAEYTYRVGLYASLC